MAMNGQHVVNEAALYHTEVGTIEGSRIHNLGLHEEIDTGGHVEFFPEFVLSANRCHGS